MKRQDYVFGSTTTNVEEQSASALNNGWAELSILYSRVLNGVCAALSQSTNYVSQEVANAIEGMGAELDPANNSQLLTVLQSLAIKESDFQTPVTPTNKGATMKEIEDLVTTSFVFKGYVSTTAPAQNLVEGNLWINSATMPTNFPIAAAAVKQWNGSEWVAYGSDYTPGNFDCFRNLNDNEGYYWFGGEWQVISTDLSTDYFTLNQVSGRWEIKNSVKLPGTPTVDTPTATETKAIVNVEYVNQNAISSRNYTNCITELPQNLIFTVSGNTLTLKAGSKVYVPNGPDGYETQNIVEDISVEIPNDWNYEFWIFKQASANALDFVETATSDVSSSSPVPGDYVEYNGTENVCGLYLESSGFARYESLPLAYIIVSNGQITIDEVFDPVCYMGKYFFVLPGIKMLMPNGRNTDGTLKNIYKVSDSVKTLKNNNNLAAFELVYLQNDTLGASDMKYWQYSSLHNAYIHDEERTTYVPLCLAGTSNRGTYITTFLQYQPFQVASYQDLQNNIPAGIVAAFAGTTPPSGWLKCDGSAVSRTTYAKLFAAIGTTYGTGGGSTTFNLPTQSVLPLGTSAPIVSTSTAAIQNQFKFDDSNIQGSLLTTGTNGSDVKFDSGSPYNVTNQRLILNPNAIRADLSQATGAKAIVCIKY